MSASRLSWLQLVKTTFRWRIFTRQKNSWSPIKPSCLTGTLLISPQLEPSQVWIASSTSTSEQGFSVSVRYSILWFTGNKLKLRCNEFHFPINIFVALLVWNAVIKNAGDTYREFNLILSAAFVFVTWNGRGKLNDYCWKFTFSRTNVLPLSCLCGYDCQVLVL